MKRIIFKIAALFLFFLQSFMPAQGQDLFRYVDQTSISMTQRQSDFLTTIQNRAWTVEVHIVRINDVLSLSSRQSLSINLPTESVESSKTYFDSPEDSVFTWASTIGDEKGNVLLTVTGTNMMGTIQIGKTSYGIEPLGRGLHVLTKLDNSKFPSDESPDNYARMKSRKNVSKSKETHSSSTSPVQGKQGPVPATHATIWIDVLVVYTNAAKDSEGGTSGINTLINSSIGNVNFTNLHSGLSAKLNLVAKFEVNYSESEIAQTDLNFLMGKTDGIMDEVHAARDAWYADLVVLLVAPPLDDCGTAGSIPAISGTAFAVVSTECSVFNKSFVHEVGHLLGGYHDNESNQIARGYRLIGPEPFKLTIMANKTAGENTVRIFWWSDDERKLPGTTIALGDATHDVAQQWENRDDIVSNFRQSPPPPSFSVNINGPGIAPCAIGTWTANVSNGTSPYSYQWYHRWECGGFGLAPCGTWNSVGTNSSTLQLFLCSGNSTLRVDATDGQGNFATKQKPVVDSGGIDPAVQEPEITSENLMAAPVQFSLSPNYPNPFNPETEIVFALPEAGLTSLIIYDLQGREVAKLIDGEMNAGNHNVTWDARNAASGVYIYRLTSGNFVDTKKMVLMK